MAALVESCELTYIELRAECLCLYNQLDMILDCKDPRCWLCSSCLNTLNPSPVYVEPPLIAEDDPVRVYRDHKG